MTDKLIQEAEAIVEVLGNPIITNMRLSTEDWKGWADTIQQLLSALKAQEWQEIENLVNNEICDYWVTDGKDVYQGTRYTTGKWYYNHTSIELDFKPTHFKPITTPEVKDKSDIFDNDEVVTHFLNTAAENQKDNK